MYCTCTMYIFKTTAEVDTGNSLTTPSVSSQGKRLIHLIIDDKTSIVQELNQTIKGEVDYEYVVLQRCKFRTNWTQLDDICMQCTLYLI